MRRYQIAILSAMLCLAAPVRAEETEEEPKPAAGKTESAQTEILFQKGRDALYRGQVDEAIKVLEKAAAADTTKTRYRLHLARAYYYAGRSQDAEAPLKKILEAASDHVEAGQLLAEIYSKQGKHKDVLSVLGPLLKYRKDYPSYHLLAEAAYSLEDHAKARRYYEEAIKLNPQNATDHYQLGNIYLAGGFFSLAAEFYQKALALGLESPTLRYKLGSAYFNLRNYFGRIAVATVKAGEPGTISGKWYLIEFVPGQQDRFRVAPAESAIFQVAKAIAGGLKDRPDLHFLRANIYLNARRYAQAHEMFGHIEKDIPEEDKALYYYYYAQAAFGVQKYDRYLELLNRAIELDDKAYRSALVEAYEKVAEQHNQAGQLGKYIEYLEKTVAESPQTASLHQKLANAYEEDRQFAKAIRQLRMVLDLEPEHPERMELLNRIEKCRSQLAIAEAKAGPADKPKPE